MRHEIPKAQEVAMLGPAVIVHGPAAIETYRLLSRGVAAAQRQDGIGPNPRVRALLAAFAEAARMSACPVTDVREEATSAQSDLGRGNRIGTREAADLMGISERQVRRRATELDGRNVRGRWTYDLATVTAAVERKTA